MARRTLRGASRRFSASECVLSCPLPLSDATLISALLLQLLDKANKAAVKSHKERVAEFNEKLENLSEHYDIPKVRFLQPFSLALPPTHLLFPHHRLVPAKGWPLFSRSPFSLCNKSCFFHDFFSEIEKKGKALYYPLQASTDNRYRLRLLRRRGRLDIRLAQSLLNILTRLDRLVLRWSVGGNAGGENLREKESVSETSRGRGERKKCERRTYLNHGIVVETFRRKGESQSRE
jgi:hypothetical protein